MLPQVQMHPQTVPRNDMVQGRQRRSSASRRHDYPEYGQQLEDPWRSRDGHGLQSFPIRSSLGQGRAAAAAVPHPHRPDDHRLRRKTPNGTINAGYDASPTPGPPPMKHMVLAVTGPHLNHMPSHLHTTYTNPFRDQTLHHQNVENATKHGAYNAHWPTRSEMSMPLRPGVWPPDGASYRQPPWPSSTYQAFLAPQRDCDLVFCPPQIPPNEFFGLAQGNAQLSQPWFPGGFVDSHGKSSHSGAHFGDASMSQTQQRSSSVIYGDIYNDLPSSLLPEPFTSTFSNPASFRNRDQLAQGHDRQMHFQERALARAQQSYLDLLAWLQSGGRKVNEKGGSSLIPQVPTRLLVHPKKPMPWLQGLPSRQALIHQAASTAVLPNGSRRHSVNGQYYPNQAYGQSTPSGSLAHTDTSMIGLARQPISNTYGPPPLINDVNGTPDHFSPSSNIQSSLEVLETLCQHSGWTWVEGMFLGGCLHFALEHYHDALKWFSAVQSQDPSNVETVANLAATLYCLNRQEEAEQYWLKAIKLRPGCLEAAEHLIGLLYRKRSRDAIDVVTFVQQSLRLQSDGLASNSQALSQAAATAESWTAGSGFGSSGYALSDADNGRVLALVHAKGTMLYGIKDVKNAASAFEEAVLISVGRRVKDVQDLIRRIQAVLSPVESGTRPSDPNSPQPFLLPPERARQTAQLLFANSEGLLPGLRFVADGAPRRAATQTTSNSLLSLAKIYQDALSSGNTNPNSHHQPSNVGDILALYYLSLSLQESPSTANNVGILLAGVQQVTPTTRATATTTTARSSQLSVPGVTPGSGLALALSYYDYGLRLDPRHVHLHTNLGSLLKDIGQLDLAIRMYEQAVACDPTFDIALTNLGNAVKDRGRTSEAIMYYRRAVQANPDFAEAVCGLSTALNSVCDWSGRGGVILEAGKYDRWHVDNSGMLLDARAQGQGSGLTQRVVDIVHQQLDEAAQWGVQVLQSPAIHDIIQQLQPLCNITLEGIEKSLQSWIGRRWEGSRVVRLMERASRALMRQWYHDLYVADRHLPASHYRRPRLPASLGVPPAPTVLPFHTFTTPLSARDIRAISQRNAIRISCSALRSPWLPSSVYRPPPPPAPHLNVGYVSSDFNNHPLAHLMQSVFGFHDPKRIKAICYATTPSDKSPHRLQIEQEAPVFRDASSWSSEKLIEQILRDEIHILVNLNGYTRGARNEIFAVRPAPIQMSFMGFAGTLGAEWCDYLLADETAVPRDTVRPCRDNLQIRDVFKDNAEDDDGDWMYSENIIFCRDTFFCCDHAQSCDASERQMSWEDEVDRRWKMRRELFPDLPDDTIILGNFNQLYKIDPTTFRCWLRILSRVPKARLWLLRFPELGESNLRHFAESWAGPEVASRVIFTDVAPKSQHISRARVCDLFLDTPECNAHTTAADILWSSTPLLTLPRYPYKMCSRMAASILTGALPRSPQGKKAADELIATGESEYEQAAVRLANGLAYNQGVEGGLQGTGRLAEIRKLLWESKWTCGLFDTRRWVADVEEAYEAAWTKWVDGESGDIYL